MVGNMEPPTSTPTGLGFSVLHQKVWLDVDFSTKSIKGKTEILIGPHSQDLKKIRLNCRQCSLRRLNINGKAPTLSYNDPFTKLEINSTSTVHQHHMLRQKLSPQLKEPPEEELIVNLPKSVRIEELDPFSMEAQNFQLSRGNGITKSGSGDVSALASTPAPRVDDLGARFKPLTVLIEFTISKVRDGLHFVGVEEGDFRYPHAYTMNSQFPGSACSLFPCIDDLSSRCTWEISITTPKTLGDAVRHLIDGSNRQHYDQLNGLLNGANRLNEVTRDEGFAQDLSGLTDEEKMLDMVVVCSGDLTDEIIDPNDENKRISSFICSNPVTAQHIGFAIGPFEHVDLSEFRETDEDEKLGQNAIRVHGFCLPGRDDDVRNTCMPMAKAIDFFTLTYGSYPFPSYKMCFVDDQVTDTVETASLALCSNRRLFPSHIIDPVDTVTRQLVHSLARQWVGINIVAKEPRDTWVVVGIAYFMTDMFLKKLSGNNEYRFRQKKASDLLCEIDVARPSIYDMGAIMQLDPNELDFIELKAPLVLFILDRRLVKTGGSSGLSRIISRILLNAKVGELPDGALDTRHFIRTCEKLGHAKLEVFFQQWVYGAGCPVFTVTQRFNKKKLVVEMLLTQTQCPPPPPNSHGQVQEHKPTPDRNLSSTTFMRDVKEHEQDIYAGPVQPAFSGPMTIRIHEADGTPYEHIVDIKDASTRVDIPYNTKYKRLKRSRRQKERAAAAAGIVEISAEAQDDVLLYCLGDVLQSEEEVKEWRLVDWSKEDEDKMNVEHFEWLRMDADFEWLCKMTIIMPGYMFVSQLQQDRDVVAQLESLQYLASQESTYLMSTILVRTLMDKRYFHGIRTTAAEGLARCATSALQWMGLFHLKKAFEELFCYPGSAMARPNDFSNRTAYYIQCTIMKAIAKVRDRDGKVPMDVKRFLFDQLKFNDNANNYFSDYHYIASLMRALSESLVGPQNTFNFAFEDDEDDSAETREMQESIEFQKIAIEEIERYRRLDEWIPSFQNIFSVTALDCKRRLQQEKVIPFDIADFLRYTQEGTFDLLRLKAFDGIVELGMLKSDFVMGLFLYSLQSDLSPFFRFHLQRIFNKGLGMIAIGDHQTSETEFTNDALEIVQDEGAAAESRKVDLARKQTIPGALKALKAEIGTNEMLKQAFWRAVRSPNLGLLEIRELLDICALLYEAKTSLIVHMRYPRYYKLQYMGQGVLKFRPAGVRTTMKKSVEKPVVQKSNPKIKLTTGKAAQEPDESGGSGVIKLVTKPKKTSAHANAAASTAAASTATSPEITKPKQKFTLKLKLSGAGREPPSQ